MSKICGISIAKNAIKYDYCLKESILSMIEACDYVIVAYVHSEDGTKELLESIDSDKLKILYLTEDDWNLFNDKNRLSYITNIAIEEADRMGFLYVFSVQADEVLHEKSYNALRRAVTNNGEGYLCKRINLWHSPYLELNVPHNRMPCSDVILRLAKASYRAYDDAESIAAPAEFGFIEQIQIYHMGFVRKREVMKDKIINMQVGVFSMSNYDNKLDQCDVFAPELWFDPVKDLKPIEGSLPLLIQNWAKERDYTEKPQ